MRHLLGVILVLLACGRACADYTGIETGALRAAGVLSTNWLAEMKQAIPSAPVMGESNFHVITNWIAEESQRGNIAAQGLWGFLVVVQSRSPEGTATGLRLLRNSATNGFAPAMLNLGLLLQGGEYVPRDDGEAFHWFRKAADKDNPEGLFQLGACHHTGSGTRRDFAKAAECYRRAADLTNYVAMKSLGYLLMNGLGVDKDTEEARHWLTRSAKEGGNRRAMYNLGALCGANVSDTNRMAEAFQWFKQSAELGDALGCLQLANFYYRGWGVQSNLGNYRFWRARAAVLGATEAQFWMGAAYRTGDGVPKDMESSLAWYRKAAAKNHPAALFDLAVHYSQDKTNRLSRLLAESHMLQAAQAGHREAQFQCAMSSFRGDLGAPDCEAGKQWLAKAADNGWARAEFFLFHSHYNGASPIAPCPAYRKDVPEAIKWLRRAAEHQNLQAQSFLAVLLIQGKDVEQNKGEAESLLRNAAERGYASAQNDLGYAIFNGDTAKRDLVEAAMWCRLARSQTTTDTNLLRRAEDNFLKVFSELDPSQRLGVDGRVKSFRVLPVAEPDPMTEDLQTNPAYQHEDGRSGH